MSGKGTLNGQAVAGEVVFLGADRKEAGSPINLGVYTVSNPPKGEVQALVKGIPSPPTPPGGYKDGAPKGPPGVAPPAKYSRPNNGLNKFNVTGGNQKHDIELTP